MRPLSTLLIAVVLSVSGLTRADAPKATDRADELFEQGASAYDAGRYADAHAKLEGAWALKKTYDIAGNLGVVAAKLGRYGQAAEMLSWALQHFPPTETNKARRGFEQELEKARAQVGTLRIRVSVDGAEVSVNGRAVGAAPLDEVFVEPGTVGVRVKRDGYQPVERSITVAKGGRAEASITLLLEAAPRRSVVPGAVLGGVAGGALVTGVALVAVAANKHATDTSLNNQITQAHGSCVAGAANLGPQCATLQSTSSSADALSRAGVGMFVVAGAMGAASIAYFLWPQSRPSATTSGGLRVLPTASPTGGGLLLSGAF
jgi:PEGA domain